MRDNLKYVLVLIILFTVGLISACNEMVDPEKERTFLLETDRAFAAESIDEGTANAFQKFLTEEALQFTGNGGVVKGNEAIYKYMLAAMDTAFVLDWEPKEAEVSQQGDMGYTWGNYIVYKKLSEGELDSVSSGKYVNVWLKQPDGSWKVSLDIGNVSR